jgi:hypothetical protein
VVEHRSDLTTSILLIQELNMAIYIPTAPLRVLEGVYSPLPFLPRSVRSSATNAKVFFTPLLGLGETTRKIIAMVRDNAGAFRCVHVRNPRLFRREVAARAGGASFSYSSAAVLGGSPNTFVHKLQRRVLPHIATAPILEHGIGSLAAGSWAGMGTPLLKAQRVWRQARKALGVLACQRIFWSNMAPTSGGNDYV